MLKTVSFTFASTSIMQFYTEAAVCSSPSVVTTSIWIEVLLYHYLKAPAASAVITALVWSYRALTGKYCISFSAMF